MATVQKASGPPAKRQAGKAAAKRSAAKAPAKTAGAVRKPAPETRAKGSGDPTGKVMARLRGSLGSDYNLDI